MGSIGIVRETSPTVDLVWQAVGIAERVTSAVLLVAISPVIGASAVAVSFLSRRTPLIAHRRVGWCGSTLWMLKLRIMWGQDSLRAATGSHWIEYIHDDEGPENKQDSDPRVTHWFARFCRRHSLDEIPQLWHVIAGEMSLVGPRPLTATELARHYGAAAQEILQVKPGLAGLWQVSGRNRLSYPERRSLDLKLARNRSLRMYLQVLLRTIPEVLRGSNSW
jgi:lipopolysaccharide/colanic/teichoic acid biosynthesis glycosyltransferase